MLEIKATGKVKSYTSKEPEDDEDRGRFSKLSMQVELIDLDVEELVKLTNNAQYTRNLAKLFHDDKGTQTGYNVVGLILKMKFIDCRYVITWPTVQSDVESATIEHAKIETIEVRADTLGKFRAMFTIKAAKVPTVLGDDLSSLLGREFHHTLTIQQSDMFDNQEANENYEPRG